MQQGKFAVRFALCTFDIIIIFMCVCADTKKSWKAEKKSNKKDWTAFHRRNVRVCDGAAKKQALKMTVAALVDIDADKTATTVTGNQSKWSKTKTDRWKSMLQHFSLHRCKASTRNDCPSKNCKDVFDKQLSNNESIFRFAQSASNPLVSGPLYLNAVVKCFVCFRYFYTGIYFISFFVSCLQTRTLVSILISFLVFDFFLAIFLVQLRFSTHWICISNSLPFLWYSLTTSVNRMTSEQPKNVQCRKSNNVGYKTVLFKPLVEGYLWRLFLSFSLRSNDKVQRNVIKIGLSSILFT